MMNLPIFNLAWSFNQRGDFGLQFLSEISSESQDFGYFLPVPVDFFRTRPSFDDWEDQMLKQTYYFPIEIDGIYSEIKGTIKYLPELVGLDIKSSMGPEVYQEISLSFVISNSQPINFLIDIFSIRSFYRKANISTKFIHQYIGTEDNEFLKKLIFIPIIPQDLKGMNNLYLEKKILLVGYIPEYKVDLQNF